MGGRTARRHVASDAPGRGLPGHPPDARLADDVWGLVPGSVGETSTCCILLGALLLLFTGIASGRIMLSVVAGGAGMALLLQHVLPDSNPYHHVSVMQHLLGGGFAFGAVFMATDPVTAAQTGTGKWIYGLLVGIMAIIIRVLNPGYPEGMMLAILLMNTFAPLIDWCVVQRGISRRIKRGRMATPCNT